MSADSEIIEDLGRLRVDFEHVEKLLTVAASLHRKLLRASRLSTDIFNTTFTFQEWASLFSHTALLPLHLFLSGNLKRTHACMQCFEETVASCGIVAAVVEGGKLAFSPSMAVTLGLLSIMRIVMAKDTLNLE